MEGLLQTYLMIAAHVLDMVVVITIGIKRITLELYLTLLTIGWQRRSISL